MSTKNETDLYITRKWVYEWKCPKCGADHKSLTDPREYGLLLCHCTQVSTVTNEIHSEYGEE